MLVVRDLGDNFLQHTETQVIHAFDIIFQQRGKWSVMGEQNLLLSAMFAVVVEVLKL